ncbi:hypothetical protein BH20ACI1_BH20ACI1_23860 [soil metagenome]
MFISLTNSSKENKLSFYSFPPPKNFVKKESITAKAMQDADKAQQKKKFVGMNTTTAIVIGAVIASAIIIVLATKGGNDRPRGPVQCVDVRFPCP